MEQRGIIERSTEPTQEFDASAEVEKMAAAMGPEREEAFRRVVMAGKKVLYGSDTQDIINEFMGQDATMEEKLGVGIANLVIMIDNKAQGNIPKDVIIPAATVLLFDAADFLRQSGEDVSVDLLGAAYEQMFYAIYAGYGASPEQVDQAFDRFGQMQMQEGAQ